MIIIKLSVPSSPCLSPAGCWGENGGPKLAHQACQPAQLRPLCSSELKRPDYPGAVTSDSLWGALLAHDQWPFRAQVQIRRAQRQVPELCRARRG